MYKKVWCICEVVFCLLSLLFFLRSRCRPRRWILKSLLSSSSSSSSTQCHHHHHHPHSHHLTSNSYSFLFVFYFFFAGCCCRPNFWASPGVLFHSRALYSISWSGTSCCCQSKYYLISKLTVNWLWASLRSAYGRSSRVCDVKVRLWLLTGR